MKILKSKNFFLNKHLSLNKKKDLLLRNDSIKYIDIEKQKKNKSIEHINKYSIDLSLLLFFLNKIYFLTLNSYKNYSFFMLFEIIIFCIYVFLIKKLSFFYSYYMLISNLISVLFISFILLNKKYYNYDLNTF